MKGGWTVYEKLKKIQQLLWDDDDRMDQEILFEIQEVFADLLLEVATAEKKIDDLVKSFPWLYCEKDK